MEVLHRHAGRRPSLVGLLAGLAATRWPGPVEAPSLAAARSVAHVADRPRARSAGSSRRRLDPAELTGLALTVALAVMALGAPRRRSAADDGQHRHRLRPLRSLVRPVRRRPRHRMDDRRSSAQVSRLGGYELVILLARWSWRPYEARRLRRLSVVAFLARGGRRPVRGGRDGQARSSTGPGRTCSTSPASPAPRSRPATPPPRRRPSWRSPCCSVGTPAPDPRRSSSAGRRTRRGGGRHPGAARACTGSPTCSPGSCSGGPGSPCARSPSAARLLRFGAPWSSAEAVAAAVDDGDPTRGRVEWDWPGSSPGKGP